MSDFGDYSGDEYEQDWLYVEEHYDEADDLAEHTCPSPVYQFNIDEDFGDYDPYDYWEDLAYLSDSYHDGNVNSQPGTGDQKRKSVVIDAQARPTKKRRRNPQEKDIVGNGKGTETSISQLPPVLWVTNRERHLIALRESVPIQGRPGPVFSLLKDWKERFKNSPGFSTNINNEEVNIIDAENDTSVEGDGFDLDISSIAKILSNSDSMDELRKILEAQGFDSKVIDVAMKDISEGKQYQEGEFDENFEAGAGAAEDGADEIDHAETEEISGRPSRAVGSGSGGGGGAGGGRSSTHLLSNGASARVTTELASPAVSTGHFQNKNATVPAARTSPSKTAMRTTSGKGFKRTREVSPPVEANVDEQMMKRTRRKKNSFSEMT